MTALQGFLVCMVLAFVVAAFLGVACAVVGTRSERR